MIVLYSEGAPTFPHISYRCFLEYRCTFWGIMKQLAKHQCLQFINCSIVWMKADVKDLELSHLHLVIRV